MTERAATAGLADQLHRTYQRLLHVLDSTADEHLHERLGLTAPPVSFHLWHAARMADRFGARVPSLLPEPAGRPALREHWETDAVAARWGLDAGRLGEEQNAMGLSDEDAERIALPGRDELRAYAVSAFGAAEAALDGMDDADLARVVVGMQGHEEPLSTTVSGQLQHAARHLGMIEALRGVLGEHGTATA